MPSQRRATKGRPTREPLSPPTQPPGYSPSFLFILPLISYGRSPPSVLSHIPILNLSLLPHLFSPFRASSTLHSPLFLEVIDALFANFHLFFSTRVFFRFWNVLERFETFSAWAARRKGFKRASSWRGGRGEAVGETEQLFGGPEELAIRVQIIVTSGDFRSYYRGNLSR